MRRRVVNLVSVVAGAASGIAVHTAISEVDAGPVPLRAEATTGVVYE